MVRQGILKGAVPTKIFAHHKLGVRRLPLSHALSACSVSDVSSIMQRAVSSGELTQKVLHGIFIYLRKKNQISKCKQIADLWSDEYGRVLNSLHLGTLMTSVVSRGEWKWALEYWNILTNNPKNVISSHHYTALIGAYRCAGLWQEVLSVLSEMESELGRANVQAQHSSLVALRNHAPWKTALSYALNLSLQVLAYQEHSKCRSLTTSNPTYSYEEEGTELQDAKSGDAHLVAEIFHVINRSLHEIGLRVSQQDRRQEFCTPSSTADQNWIRHELLIRALKLYNAVPSVDRSTSMRNACLEIVASGGHWRKAFSLVSHGVEQSLKHRVLTPETLDILVSCCRTDISKLSSILRLACDHKITAPRSLLYAMLYAMLCRSSADTNLVTKNEIIPPRINEAMEFFMRIRQRSLLECVQSNELSLSTLYEAILDVLLKMKDADAALYVAIQLQEYLAPAIPMITSGICVFGSEHKRIIVEGRVAVLDSHLYVSPELNARELGSIFDTLLVPYTHVRNLFCLHEKAKKLHLNKESETYSRQMKVLSQKNHGKLNKKLYIMSFIDQLRAHRHFYGHSQKLSSFTENLFEGFRSSQRVCAPKEKNERVLLGLRDTASKSDFGIRPSSFSTSSASLSDTRTLCQSHKGKYEKENTKPVEQALSMKEPGFTKSRGHGTAMRLLAIANMIHDLNPECEVYILSRKGHIAQHCRDILSSLPKTSGAQGICIVESNSYEDIRKHFEKYPGAYPFRINESDSPHDSLLSETYAINEDHALLNIL